MAETPSMTSPQIGDSESGVRRRDFIHVATGAFFAAGGAMVAWPLVNQMNPAADTLAMSKVEVDISKLTMGQAMKVKWQGKPVFIRFRTPEEIAKSKAVVLSELRDPQSDAERVKSGHESILVTLGVCTHLGCVPLGTAQGETRGDYDGYFCPCHGSHYDTAGRIRKGPAPRNLEVPDYTFKSPTVLEIG